MALENTTSSEKGCVKMCTLQEIEGKGWAADHCTTAKGAVVSPPFETTGVDFAGPLYVKTQSSMTKAYIALSTCAVTRAVHLDLFSDMSTENFLLVLKRLISRRGLCKVIYSDNAKTFKRADQDLKELWKGIKDPSQKRASPGGSSLTEQPGGADSGNGL